jgi:hypothetical protein
MFTRELTLFAFATGYVRKLVADVTPARWAEQPHAGMNHPAWVVGHLVVANDYGLQLLGQPMTGPTAWHQLHGPGSQPTTELSRYAPASELLAEFERTSALFRAAVPTATPEQLAPRHQVPMAFLQAAFPTVGELLAHLLATHIAVHAGQVSTWRRVLGFPAV